MIGQVPITPELPLAIWPLPLPHQAGTNRDTRTHGVPTAIFSAGMFDRRD